MSLMSPSVAEKILMSKDKEFKNNFKKILKEKIEQGDERAARAYDELFPKMEWGEGCSPDNKYRWRITRRFQKDIPTMICETCGKMTQKVQEFENPNLKDEKRKTWRRAIKRNLNYELEGHGRQKRNQRLFFSYDMMGCIKKKHKLTIRYWLGAKTIADMGFAYKKKVKVKI